MPDLLASSVLVARHQLIGFYRTYKHAHPASHLTEVHDITVKMIGSSGYRKLKFKAAETFGFMLFLLQTLRQHHGRIGYGAALQEAGECLEKIVGILDRSPVNMGVGIVQECLDLYKRHLTLAHVVCLKLPIHTKAYKTAFCLGGCIFAEGRRTGSPKLLGEVRGPIWRSKDHLVLK